MAVFLKLQSKNKINENTKFGLKCYEFKFFLTGPIDVVEWPIAFSEYMYDTIMENALPTGYIGISITHPYAEGVISYMPTPRLSPTVFDDNFSRIFNNVDMLSGTICIEATYVNFSGYPLKK